VNCLSLLYICQHNTQINNYYCTFPVLLKTCINGKFERIPTMVYVEHGYLVSGLYPSSFYSFEHWTMDRVQKPNNHVQPRSIFKHCCISHAKITQLIRWLAMEWTADKFLVEKEMLLLSTSSRLVLWATSLRLNGLWGNFPNGQRSRSSMQTTYL
jgi:hypothetical protein